MRFSESDNITVVETCAAPREASSDKNASARIEHVSLIYRSTCSAQRKLLPMTSSEFIFPFTSPLMPPCFHFHRVFMLNVCCPIFTSYLRQMPLSVSNGLKPWKEVHPSAKVEIVPTYRLFFNPRERSLKVERMCVFALIILLPESLDLLEFSYYQMPNRSNRLHSSYYTNNNIS